MSIIPVADGQLGPQDMLQNFYLVSGAERGKWTAYPGVKMKDRRFTDRQTPIKRLAIIPLAIIPLS